MRLFLCESGGQHVIIAAADEPRALRLAAEAEIQMLFPGSDPEPNIAEFMGGWLATELNADVDEGIQVAWWSTLTKEGAG